MGPLQGLKVIELAGIGPAPFCAMMLADMGADVIRVDRESAAPGAPPPVDCLLRNRRSIALNLKSPAGVATLLELIDGADALIEGFRPGVTERLGLGPDVCLARNPRLVYGRMTGWGQDRPAGIDGRSRHQLHRDHGRAAPDRRARSQARAAAQSRGRLRRRRDDAAGGGPRRIARGRSFGQGPGDRRGDDRRHRGPAQHHVHVPRSKPGFRDATGEEMLAGGAPYYGTYETSDGKYLAIGSIEPQFYAELLEKLGVDRKHLVAGFPAGRKGWAEAEAAIAAAVRTRTRDEWAAIFEGSDACVAPVLSLGEAARHPHNAARGTFIEVDGVEQHAPAPRFSRTAAAPVQPPHRAGADTESVLRDAGFSPERIAELRAAGALS